MHPTTLVCCLGCLLLAMTAIAAPEPAVKRVLVVHSFVNAAPPFTTHSTAFEAELTTQMGEGIDLDEISLDVARYADLDIQEALLEFMQKRQSKWQPDLVVPIGSPAAIFVAQFRDRLFPDTPIVYCGLDRRRLPDEALEKNAAFVGSLFDIPGFVEDMLQIAPATTNIAVIIGNSPLEQFWAAAFKRGVEPFTNRVSFTWYNDLPFDRMLQRVSHLPPRSFIFLILLMRDASGVTYNADEALQRLHAVANAPINGIFQHQLGLGIVGGRLYQAELEGVEAARIAVRVLRGESASSFPPKVIGPVGPRYDARELRRWNISEKQLPHGSLVQFREPSLWDRYRVRIIIGVSVCIAQALLIFALLANLFKRWRAERSLKESENRFRIAADAAQVMMWMSGTDKLCTFLNKPWLEFTGRTLEQSLGDGWVQDIHPDDEARSLRTYQDAFEARQPFMMSYRLRRHDGEYRWIYDTGVPRRDHQGNFSGYVGSCLDITESKHKTEALAESENRLQAILDTAIEGIITTDEQGIIQSVNTATVKLFGYGAEELVGQKVTMLLPAVFEDEEDPGHRSDKPKMIGTSLEVSGRRKDGSLFPVELGVREIVVADGRIFTAFVRDLSEKKLAEQKAREFGGRLLHAQEAERARLARELHDDVTQRLARLAIDAGRIERDGPGIDFGQRLREVREGLARLSEDVHSLSYKLHPSVLEDLGLAAALRAECERFSRQESIPAEVKLIGLPDIIPSEPALCLFRIAQEALRNVARHSRATAVDVHVVLLDGGLQLSIGDDGIGFNSSLKRERLSLGLASMRERVRQVGGQLDIESAPGRGTNILAWVPLNGEPS